MEISGLGHGVLHARLRDTIIFVIGFLLGSGLIMGIDYQHHRGEVDPLAAYYPVGINKNGVPLGYVRLPCSVEDQ